MPLANTSEHDTPLLCQARDNPAVSKHDKGYCVKARDRLLSQSTRHMQGQTNRHTAVIKVQTLLPHSTTHQSVRALPSIKHSVHPQIQCPPPESWGFRGRGKAGYTSGNISHFVAPWEAGGPSPLKPARLSQTPQSTIHRCCVKHETTLLCPSTTKATVLKQGTDC